MTPRLPLPLLVGEVFVDVTITPRGQENKLRLGGIAHAARGFWATDIPFAAAVVLPTYLEPLARQYLSTFGCVHFFVLAHVSNAPNVTLIFDATEVSDQEYDTLLRDEKRINYPDRPQPFSFEGLNDALIFPGSYDLTKLGVLLPRDVRLHIDAAYDLPDIALLESLPQKIETIFVSTSSPYFLSLKHQTLEAIANEFRFLNPQTIILKENRGGSRLYRYGTGDIESLPAQLGPTVNSVGVGDVFDAVYVAELPKGFSEAAWRATQASSAYAHTTEPDVFKRDVIRASELSVGELKELGGTSLPWDERQRSMIYLAAPDFAHGNRTAIDRAIAALEYHNFRVCRPIQENGEVPQNSDQIALAEVYEKDATLLRSSSLVFAIPTGRDPGTLIEIGLAVERNIPVVIFDAHGECNNTMAIGSAYCYSSDLDECLNATFRCLSSPDPAR